MTVVQMRKPQVIAAKFVTMGELMVEPARPKEVILGPWLREREAVLLHAPSGLGKTQLALTMAITIASGGEFIGWKADRPRRVLWVDGEMDMEDLRERLRDLAGAVAGGDMEACGRNLVLFAHQRQAADFVFPDLATEEGQDEVMGYVEKKGAEVVFLDNLTTLANVEDENSASAFQPITAFLRRVKRTRTVVLVHHSGKTGSTYRGSSAIITTFDVSLALRPIGERDAQEGTGFTVEFQKFRGRPTEGTQQRDVILTETGWTAEVAEREREERVLAAVRSLKFATSKEIVKHLGMTPAMVSRTKSVLIAQKKITENEWGRLLSEAKKLREQDEREGQGEELDPEEDGAGSEDF